MTTVTSAASTVTSASKNTETITATLIHSTNATTISTVKKPESSATESKLFLNNSAYEPVTNVVTAEVESKTAKATASASVTSVPNSGASQLTSSLALVAGVIMAMVYLN